MPTEGFFLLTPSREVSESSYIPESCEKLTLFSCRILLNLMGINWYLLTILLIMFLNINEYESLDVCQPSELLICALPVHILYLSFHSYSYFLISRNSTCISKYYPRDWKPLFLICQPCTNFAYCIFHLDKCFDFVTIKFNNFYLLFTLRAFILEIFLQFRS